jgi:hypothetical protein
VQHSNTDAIKGCIQESCMKLSPLAFAAALSMGSVGAFAATQTLDVSTGSAGFFNTPPAGAFSDSYIFSVVGPVSLNGIISSAVNGGQNIDFTGPTLIGPSGTLSFAKINNDPFEVWSFYTSILNPGTYTLIVQGTNSAAVGTYSGDIALAAVPEPSTYGLMLAGAAMVGLVAIRRRPQG